MYYNFISKHQGKRDEFFLDSSPQTGGSKPLSEPVNLEDTWVGEVEINQWHNKPGVISLTTNNPVVVQWFVENYGHCFFITLPSGEVIPPGNYPDAEFPED